MEGIMDHLVTISRPAKCETPPWTFLTASQSLRVVDGAPDVLAESFTKRFTLDELVQAGAYVAAPSASPKLSPVLAATNRPFGLVKDERRRVLDVVNQLGSLCMADPPALSCCVDHLTRKRSSAADIIF